MKKDTHLINIYLKIHNKKTLTIDDLRYLAKYDPECFSKTCKNVVYNIPETKPIMEPSMPISQSVPQLPDVYANKTQSIDIILDNLKNLEENILDINTINADQVKNLLGNLYMEFLFPHNDQYSFFSMKEEVPVSSFDKKA